MTGPATFTLREAADRLGLDAGRSGTAGAQRLYKLVQAGSLHAVRIGRQLRIPASALDEFLNGKK